MRRLQAKSFVILFMAASLAVMLCLAWLNFSVDPFAMYSGPDRDPMMISRVEQFPHMRLSKPWQLRRLQPEAVVVGSSRSGKFPPAHATWSGYVGYNAAIPGLTPREMLHFVEHSHAQGSLQKLLLGLDFATYIAGEPATRSGFAENRMMKSQSDETTATWRWQRFVDLRDTLLSYSTLSKTLLALAGGAEPVRIYYPDGTWRNNSSLLVGQAGYVYVGRNHVSLERDRKPGLEANLDTLEQILDLAYSEGLDTRLVITPVHVFVHRLWKQLGRGLEWGEFHAGVLRVNRDVARRHGATPYPVMGFNTLARVVDEPIGRQNRDSQRWFMDGVHYRSALGELMMGAAWGANTELGVQLQESTLQDYLDAIEQLSAEFERDNAEQVSRLLERIGAR
jgi:hypothetical protein